MLYLAIDQHRKHLTISVRDEAGDGVHHQQVSTRWPAVKRCFAEFQAMTQDCGGFAVIVEVCGFNDWLLRLLGEYGCREIVLLQPGERSKRKTDRRDAARLSELLWLNRTRLLAGLPVRGIRRVRIATESEQQDRRVTALRQQVGRELTRVTNRIKHLLRRHNLEQECPTKGIATAAAGRWLEQLSLDAVDRLELNHLRARRELLQRQRVELEQMIRERQRGHADAAVLATLPGAGAYTSLALASRVGPIDRFARPRSLANYWGLTPTSCNSGAATQRLGSITKQGSATARFLLGQWVLHVLRRDAARREWYKAIKRRRGAKIARVAVMRRLATIIWHMLKKREPYPAGGPPQCRLRAMDPARPGEPIALGGPPHREPRVAAVS